MSALTTLDYITRFTVMRTQFADFIPAERDRFTVALDTMARYAEVVS
jgi:hypothetical protein